MRKIVTITSPVTVDVAVDVLRRLSPRERLKVISIVLPETECELPTSEPIKRKSLYGLWKDLDVKVTAEDLRMRYVKRFGKIFHGRTSYNPLFS